jgi:hypothetical protein
MQIAARKVAWENGKLRDLLVSRGVSVQDIKEYIHNQEQIDLVSAPSNTISRGKLQSDNVFQTPEDQNADASNTHRPTSQSLRALRGHESNTRQQDFNEDSVVTTDGNQATVGTDLSSIPGLVPSPGPPHHVSSLSESSKDTNFAENCPGYDTYNSSPGDESEQQGLLSTASECYCPPTPNQTFPNQVDSLLEMSCETAASIIANMRGHEDASQARFELGCEKNKQCRIKNTTVLQVMGMD